MYNLRVLLILLISMGLDEAYSSAILQSSENQTQLMKALISGALFGSEIIFSPIQAGFSDFSSRRKGLIFAFLVTLLAMIFLLFPSKSVYFLIFLFLAALLKGIAGNIIPIARAALADSVKHNFRLTIGLSTSAIAAGYIFIKVVSQDLDSFYVPVALLITVPLILYFIFKYFFDKNDEDTNNKPSSFTNAMKKDLKSIYYNFIKDKIFSLSSCAYFFWELSFYLVFISDVELKNRYFKNFSITMCFGYLMGVLCLKLISNWHDRRVLKLGYVISIFSVLFVIVSFVSGINFFQQHMPISGYFIYSFGFGFFVPCLFSMVSKIRPSHEQGKVYGLIDSIDTVSFATAILIGIYVSGFKLIIFLSFLFLLIGTFVYNLSKKYWVRYEKRLE